MSLEIIETAILIIINISSILIGLWVFSSNKKNHINQWFGVVTILIILWVNSAYFAAILSQKEVVNFLYKLNLALVSLFLFAAYNFAIWHLVKNKKKSLFIITLVGSLFFVTLSLFTNLIVGDVVMEEWGAELIYGSFGFLYKLFALIVSVIILYYLFSYYFTSSKKERLKIQYLLVGISLFAVFNIIFNIIVPFFLQTVRFQHFGDFATIFLIGFTAYAIVKRELFDIKVALTSVFVGLIALLLFLDLLIFTEESWIQIAKGGILVMFLAFGWLLIKSVMREIKQREELAEAYVKLQQLDKAKTEFLSIASHQLRTPLTAIKGYISMVMEEVYGKLPEKMVKPLGNIYVSNERLIKLVNDLLNVSRIEAGRIEMDRSDLSLQGIAEEIIEELGPMAKGKNLYLKLEKSPEPLPKISLDRGKIRQVIMNIIDNAIKYTEEGGITVSLQKTDSRLQISISDTGDGLSEEELSCLFTSFTRGKAGTRLWVEGAGLGMYIAKKFLELHNGKIWAESKGRGRGSTFYIELPVKTAEEI